MCTEKVYEKEKYGLEHDQVKRKYGLKYDQGNRIFGLTYNQGNTIHGLEHGPEKGTYDRGKYNIRPLSALSEQNLHTNTSLYPTTVGEYPYHPRTPKTRGDLFAV